jgi:carboxypeptidase Taq
MTQARKAYERLVQRFERMAVLGEASAMLGWDASVMMPVGGSAARGDQFAVLASLSHEMLTAPDVGDDLALAQSEALPDAWQARNLTLMQRAYQRATALPGSLVEAMARANTSCEQIWREARKQSDFSMVSQALTEVVALAREQAQALSPVLGLSPYDCLMDGFQPGITAADVTPVFASYRAFLATALPKAEALQGRKQKPVPLSGPFAADRQEALCRDLSLRAGLEKDHSRLDRSTHPFCGGIPTDVRITTRYDESNFAKSLLGVMHETGHALYERGLPAQWIRQPVGSAAGMAAHESQSLIIEMQACRSDAWLGWLSHELAAYFPQEGAALAPDNLALLWRRVERGFIRVDADEMTYPAHVMMRFELEQDLFSGAVQVKDLPERWNSAMQDFLAITPPDDAQGVLQDIHWYNGLFGYFPSYTLGAMAAAQLMQAARQADSAIDTSLAQGDLAPLLRWLRTHVHGHASFYGFNDLMRAATGKPLTPEAFTDHLTRRYLDA